MNSTSGEPLWCVPELLLRSLLPLVWAKRVPIYSLLQVTPTCFGELLTYIGWWFSYVKAFTTPDLPSFRHM